MLAFATDKKRLIAILLLVVAVLLPLFLKDAYLMHLVIMTLIWGSVATQWNMTLGYGGMFHIAQFSLFAVGGYTSAMLANIAGLSPWLGLLVGGAASFLASLVIGLPSLRVKGIYLILLTFAFHFAIKELVFIFSKHTGGSMGLVVPGLGLGGWNDANFSYYFALLLFLASVGLTLFFVKSRIGRALVSLRDSEVLAMCSGVSAYRVKMVTFASTAFLTGIVGAFYSNYLSVISPEIFDFSLIVNGLGMIVIGGIGTVLGPLLGSFIITFCLEFFNELDEYSPIIVGLAILLMLRFVPNGLVDLFSRWLKLRS